MLFRRDVQISTVVQCGTCGAILIALQMCASKQAATLILPAVKGELIAANDMVQTRLRHRLSSCAILRQTHEFSQIHL
jgi:hypothetical protein